MKKRTAINLDLAIYIKLVPESETNIVYCEAKVYRNRIKNYFMGTQAGYYRKDLPEFGVYFHELSEEYSEREGKVYQRAKVYFKISDNSYSEEYFNSNKEAETYFVKMKYRIHNSLEITLY